MHPTLTHVFDSHLDLHYGKQQLFRYIYRPQTDPGESPKPFFHPLNTLDGNTITLFRPHDHVWHHGLAMTMAVLSGQNFWGGPSYVHEQGYVRLPNSGQQLHQSWDTIRCDETAITFSEHLDWVTMAGETWLRETRVITVNEINLPAGYWVLDFGLHLQNVRGEELVFGSPTTEGRPMAGYGSLFWRGPRSFLHGRVLAGGGLSGPEVMGQSADWLAFSGKHDGSNQQSTLLFIDHPDNPRHPTQWFIRNDPFACVSFAFMFDEEYPLATEETLTLHYRLVIINGGWEREQIEAFVYR